MLDGSPKTVASEPVRFAHAQAVGKSRMTKSLPRGPKRLRGAIVGSAGIRVRGRTHKIIPRCPKRGLPVPPRRPAYPRGHGAQKEPLSGGSFSFDDQWIEGLWSERPLLLGSGQRRGLHVADLRALMTPMCANIVGPPCVATKIRASIAVCHSAPCAPAFGSLVM